MAPTLDKDSVLVLASNNQGKLVEMQKRLEGSGVTVLTLKDLDLPQADETGDSTAENASLKSTGAAEGFDFSAVEAKVGRPVSKVIVAAEDTGLEIPSLGGWPGPHYALLTEKTPGGERDDEMGNAKVLAKLADQPGADRKAVFTSTLAVTEVRRDGMDAKPTLYTAEMVGRIAEKPRGDNGFGFDAILEVDGPRGRPVTFAQLDRSQKAEYSPRPKAVDKMVQAIYPKSEVVADGPAKRPGQTG
ncbi:MAG: hypothetical protein KI792_14195 [Alphaproteobacteria bacterium]|nr:hypothetical protein [Alphaproteobacteria bacterium SS10]